MTVKVLRQKVNMDLKQSHDIAVQLQMWMFLWDGECGCAEISQLVQYMNTLLVLCFLTCVPLSCLIHISVALERGKERNFTMQWAKR